ncbi:MAG TPA: hypothetical protein VKB93_10540 [Thermoanaerobaculia bacterium]|nr:hypothetical protein [Thermoanaerobaculia bacterium]
MKRILLILLLATFAFADEQPTPSPSGPTLGESQLFQVVLLRASRKGADDLDDLPKSAEKALADVRDFLPFKHYVMLDSAIVRLSRGMESSVTVNAYQVKFSYERKDNKLSIWWFTVHPATKKTEQPTPSPSRGDAPVYAPEAIKPLISTSFAMDRGETVVVGSSKINGDDALMVLLTAVPAR